MLLLHGLGASGDYFGDLYEPLTEHNRLVVPDLLGFGASLDEQHASFGLDDHLDAIDLVLSDALRHGDRIVIGAHSMGSALALALGQRHPDAIERIVIWGPPLYRSASALRSAAGHHSTMTRLFLLDTAWAARLCRINCAHRTLSGLLLAALSPKLPIAITRQASRHTWAAYRQSLNALAVTVDWESLLATSIPVHLIRGTRDNIGDIVFIRELAARHPNIDVHEILGADHHVALSHADYAHHLMLPVAPEVSTDLPTTID